MTSDAHLSAAFGAGHGGGRLAVIFGTTISAGITSTGGLAPDASSAGSNAPVVGLSRFGVGRLASITSRMLSEAMIEDSMPYLAKASFCASACVPADRTLIGPTKFTAAFVFGSYGAAANWSAGAVIDCVRNVYATAISDLVKGAFISLLSRFLICTRTRSSAFACPSEMPASCDLPPAHSGLSKSRMLPTVGRPSPFGAAGVESTPWMRLVTTKAYSVASLSGLLVFTPLEFSLLAAAGCTPTSTPACNDVDGTGCRSWAGSRSW